MDPYGHINPSYGIKREYLLDICSEEVVKIARAISNGRRCHKSLLCVGGFILYGMECSGLGKGFWQFNIPLPSEKKTLYNDFSEFVKFICEPLRSWT